MISLNMANRAYCVFPTNDNKFSIEIVKVTIFLEGVF